MNLRRLSSEKFEIMSASGRFRFRRCSTRFWNSDLLRSVFVKFPLEASGLTPPFKNVGLLNTGKGPLLLPIADRSVYVSSFKLT